MADQTAKPAKERSEIDVSVVEGDKIVVSEGKAKILFEKGQVFYNKVSSQSRDATVAVLAAFQDVLVEEAKDGKKKKKAQRWRLLCPRRKSLKLQCVYLMLSPQQGYGLCGTFWRFQASAV
eukprot:JP448327.1.p1 GENE.JP448327.1~~JP448327.1.p1  ORF type:complete len:121 (-),score=14.30 JP448327.1:78-440(-)